MVGLDKGLQAIGEFGLDRGQIQPLFAIYGIG